MFHNHYDTADITVEYSCWYDSTDAENLPEDRDCEEEWTEVFDVPSDWDAQPKGESFVSLCPKCGREASKYEDTRRERNDYDLEEYELSNGRYVRGGW